MVNATEAAAEAEKAVGAISVYACKHDSSTYEIAFPEGDVYCCRFSTDDYKDNEEDPDSPEYEEWYALDFKIVEIVKDGPNRDPRFEYIVLSRKHMPSAVTCDGEVIYQA